MKARSQRAMGAYGCSQAASLENLFFLNMRSLCRLEYNNTVNTGER